MTDGRPTSRFSYDRAAFLCIAVTFLLGIGSLHSQNNLLFIAFGVAVGVLLVNGTYAWASLAKVRVKRSVPARGEVGEMLRVRYRVTTRSRWMPGGALVISERDGGAMYEGRGVAAVSTVRRDAPARAVCRVVPVRRGVLRFDRFVVSTRFPFGAVKKSVSVSQPTTVVVWPYAEMPNEEALRVVNGASQVSSSTLQRAGDGAEVLGLREYTPGDSVRRIAWRSSARHGRLVVRQYAASASAEVRLALRLDPALSERANEAAISLAAGTLRLLAKRGRPVVLCDPSEREGMIGTLGGALDALALLDSTGERGGNENGATVVVEAKESGAVLRAVRAGVVAGGVL